MEKIILTDGADGFDGIIVWSEVNGDRNQIDSIEYNRDLDTDDAGYTMIEDACKRAYTEYPLAVLEDGETVLLPKSELNR